MATRGASAPNPQPSLLVPTPPSAAPGAAAGSTSSLPQSAAGGAGQPRTDFQSASDFSRADSLPTPHASVAEPTLADGAAESAVHTQEVPTKSIPAAEPTLTTPGGAYDPAVFERLRAWRQQAARQAGQKAFYVFPNATLKRIASARPQTLEELAVIKGVGPRKLEQYGQDLLDTINRAEEAQ